MRSKGVAGLRRRHQPHEGCQWRSEDLNRVEESTHEHFEHIHRPLKFLLGDNDAATESPRADLLVEFRSQFFQIPQRGQRGLVCQVQQDVEPVVDGGQTRASSWKCSCTSARRTGSRPRVLGGSGPVVLRRDFVNLGLPAAAGPASVNVASTVVNALE